VGFLTQRHRERGDNGESKVKWADGHRAEGRWGGLGDTLTHMEAYRNIVIGSVIIGKGLWVVDILTVLQNLEVSSAFDRG